MRKVLYSLVLCLIVFIPAVTAASPNDKCAYPLDLRGQISKNYPDKNLITLADLDEYDQKLFRRDHKSQCPGLVKVDFYGDRKPTYALVLIAGENPKRRAELIVARQLVEGWEIRSLDVTDGTPVVWREAPGNTMTCISRKRSEQKIPCLYFAAWSRGRLSSSGTARK
jgi:hypothetical protein